MLSSRAKKLLQLSYYLLFYIVLIRYACRLLKRYGITNDPHLSLADDTDYLYLTSTGVGFLTFDFIVKYLRAERSTLYHALQVHHLVGVVGYLLAYFSGVGQIITVNLSLFELSSIPLLFYSDRVLTNITLPLTWITFLLARIVWGNFIILYAIYQLHASDVDIKITVFSDVLHGFFLLANNYWFYLLTKSMHRRFPNLSKFIFAKCVKEKLN